MAKVILIDNFNREYVEDKLLKDNLSEIEAKKIANDYNKQHSSNWYWFAKAVDDNYRLSHGIKDFI